MSSLLVKPQVPAFTVPQLSEAMEVLEERANGLMVIQTFIKFGCLFGQIMDMWFSSLFLIKNIFLGEKRYLVAFLMWCHVFFCVWHGCHYGNINQKIILISHENYCIQTRLFFSAFQSISTLGNRRSFIFFFSLQYIAQKAVMALIPFLISFSKLGIASISLLVRMRNADKIMSSCI